MTDGSACFKLSNVGELCQDPITNETLCKIVSEDNVFEGSNYVNMTGDGHDLPYGCILDTLSYYSTNGSARIYWNPQGVGIPRDKNIRQICASGRSEFHNCDSICFCEPIIYRIQMLPVITFIPVINLQRTKQNTTTSTKIVQP